VAAGIFCTFAGLVPVLFNINIMFFYLASFFTGAGQGILNVATATAISSFFTGKPQSKIFCYSSVCQMVVPSCC